MFLLGVSKLLLLPVIVTILVTFFFRIVTLLELHPRGIINKF